MKKIKTKIVKNREKCKCKEFEGVEEYFLKGKLVDNILYLKTTGESGGFKDIRCVKCRKEIDEKMKIELC